MTWILGTAYAIEGLENSVQEAEKVTAADATESPEYLQLQRSIEEGRKLSTKLRADLQEVGRQKAKLEEENRKLESIQTVLASGLVGALVTACIAVLGVLGNMKRSKIDRDLKRLEVLEKARELHAKGIEIPLDIRTVYGIHTRTPP